MSYLLDTCTFLWIIADAPELSADARSRFVSPDHHVYLSAASVWEIVVKNRIGKLPLPEPVERFIPRVREAHGITSLPLDEEAALYDTRLPPIHRDPFDRMLVCQAIVAGLTILTPDELIRQYPVRTLW